ncbi:MAG: hypothetical protein CME65_04590 [Halobacteriovoraceae bacterium]|nr:hypothetical protein [Halobacteriovoraceae bacterium]|tara:strand:+ start:2219 stop:3472 length:1254 start_codon:yes stop_codon:yes gene_type:complete
MSIDQLKQYFEAEADEVNRIYFEALLKQFQRQSEAQSEISIFHPKNNPNSKVFPYAILAEKELMPVKQCADLSEEKELSSELVLIKMHAGIGSSVERAEHLEKHTGRKKLGAKGTDLFVKGKSLAELQIEQVKILNQNPKLKKVTLQNLVNRQTKEVVEKLNLGLDFIRPSIIQYKMPTIDETGKTSFERLAPGGHGFLGFQILMKLFQEPIIEPEIIAIGNGEDLNSTPDLKMLSWMEETKTPICMITTNKTAMDKKGGQLAVVKDATPYLTIIEKAQAERAGQLDYFAEIGLRDEDDFSLFNTNIVLLNTKVLSDLISRLDCSLEEFGMIIAPDLIKNEKIQDGKKFIQLEGAIASVMLNLDKYFREKLNQPLIRLLNLDSKERESFFIPIKKMEDFEYILERYTYSKVTGRFEL